MYVFQAIFTLFYKWVNDMKFIVKKQEYASRTFRLPVELLEELNTIATNKNISLNQLIVQCCEFAIENIDEEETGE